MPTTPDAQAALDRWLYTDTDLAGLTRDLEQMGVEAYTQRLKELGQLLGVDPGPLDAAARAEIGVRARWAAQSITKTHNDALRAFVEKLSPDADAAAEVEAWERARADWESRTVAVTETMADRNMADSRFREQNGVSVRMRVVPEEAQCPICQANVDMGWLTQDEADGVDVSPHPNCIHSWSYAEGLTDAISELNNIWLGSRQPEAA